MIKGKRKSNNISLNTLTKVKLENGLYAKGILTKNIKNGLFKVFDFSNKELYCNFYNRDTLIYTGRYDSINNKMSKWLAQWKY